MSLPGCLVGCSAMVLGCLRLETQSITTGLMAKHCYTASLLSMVSSWRGKWKSLKSKNGLHAGCIFPDMTLTLLGDSHPLATAKAQLCVSKVLTPIEGFSPCFCSYFHFCTSVSALQRFSFHLPIVGYILRPHPDFRHL